ncbi:nuclear transport factor 2 domain-containing protein [Cystoisospora suis]|uniref:Nuclear transport factor 2 domain-containing protein n=1 Tax=Cystoisospora suis TaxID=483139 RepID=A0A2C6KMM5_9APIC|nr:nuclear transport factor 2 domain-containing protein [Cystoisospora suis]
MSAYSVHPVTAPGSSTGPGFHHNQTSAFSAHHHPYGQASGSSAALHQPPSSGARGGAAPYGQQHHLHQQQPLQQIHLQQPPLPPPPHHQYQGFTNAVAYHQPSSQANSAQIHPSHHPYSQQTGATGPAGTLATASALAAAQNASPTTGTTPDGSMMGSQTSNASSAFLYQGARQQGTPNTALSSSPSSTSAMLVEGAPSLSASGSPQPPPPAQSGGGGGKRGFLPLEVAHSFVYQYYCMLHDTPVDLHRFYDYDSQVIRTTDREGASNAGRYSDIRVMGQHEIYGAYERGRFEKTTCRVRVIDAQENKDGGMLILVAGRLKHADEPREREFCQTVFLARQKPPRTGWYVTNEIFCYLDAAVEEVAQAAKEEALASRPSVELQLCQEQASSSQGSGSARLVSAPSPTTTSLLDEESNSPAAGAVGVPEPSSSSSGGDGLSPGDSSPLADSAEDTAVACSSDSVEESKHSQQQRLTSGESPGVGGNASVAPEVRGLREAGTAYEDDEGEEEGTVQDRRKKEPRDETSPTEGGSTGERGADQAGSPQQNKQQPRRWKREESGRRNSENAVADANWPKPGELAFQAQKCETQAQQQMQEAYNYDPKSFAFKVVHNAPRTTNGPKGFAVPASNSRSPGLTATGGGGSGRSSPQNPPAPVGGRSWGGGRGSQNSNSPGSPETWNNSGSQDSPPPSGNKKLVVLSEMPPEFTVEELKKAVADQLRKFNEGQAVEIKKPASGRSFGWFLELDCRQSAEYLMQQGLYVRGRQMRLEFARQQGSGGARGGGGRGGGGRGGRGGWSSHRPQTNGGRDTYYTLKGESSQDGRGGGTASAGGSAATGCEEDHRYNNHTHRTRFYGTRGGSGGGQGGGDHEFSNNQGSSHDVSNTVEGGGEGGQWIDAGRRGKRNNAGGGLNSPGERKGNFGSGSGGRGGAGGGGGAVRARGGGGGAGRRVGGGTDQQGQGAGWSSR